MSRALVLSLLLFVSFSAAATTTLWQHFHSRSTTTLKRASPPIAYCVVLRQGRPALQLTPFLATLNVDCAPYSERQTAQRTILGMDCFNGANLSSWLTQYAPKGVSWHVGTDHAMRIPSPTIVSISSARKRQAGVETSAPWHLQRIATRPLIFNGNYPYYGEGAGIYVFTVDTGVDASQVEFTGRATAVTNTLNGGSANDDNGHGTHVMSLLGGQTLGVAKVRSMANRCFCSSRMARECWIHRTRPARRESPASAMRIPQ
jgi:hypothetical protein